MSKTKGSKSVQLVVPEEKPQGRLDTHLTGSGYVSFNFALLNSLINTLNLKSSDETVRQHFMKSALEAMAGLAPKDEAEGMLAAQMVACHNAAMDCYKRAMVAIYPFWDDLYVDWGYSESSVRTELLGEAPNRQFVIEWRNVNFCCVSAEFVRFEVIQYENGEILTQYTGIDENSREQVSSATVGIVNETGEIALQYAYDETALTEGLAVRYIPPPMGWLQGTITDASTGLPIAGATAALAALAGRPTDSEPLLRRVLNANLRQGTAVAAQTPGYAARAGGVESMRVEALDALADWPTVSGRDRVTGLWRPTAFRREAGTPREALKPPG